MRFAWKMIAMVSVLLALSLAAGGLVAVDRAFRSELDTAVSESQEDMKLFGTTLQALCLMENDRQEPDQTVTRVLRTYSVFGNYSYWVYDAEKRPLAGSGYAFPEDLTGKDAGIIETRMERKDDAYLLLSSEKLSLLGEDFLLQRSRDVTGLVRNAEKNLETYALVMLGILFAGMLLTSLLTLWMTRPIRKISRTAGQLAEGHYERRVTVRGDDELAALGRDFNSMADALEEKIRDLEDAAQREKDFTASFAHELKTPLTSVIGYADTLRSRNLPLDRQIEAAGYIFSEGKRLETMSFALLDLFSLEREKPEMKPVETDKLIAGLADSMGYLLKTGGVTLKTDAEPMELEASSELLKTMLYNLVDNARKASKPGDTVELTGRREEGGYRFTVRDHGRGIPAESLSRITEPFYMVDKSRARAQGGAGLGLALCRKIAEAHGGTIDFESTVGEGTVVRVWIGGGKR